jgi:hypothetical protein
MRSHDQPWCPGGTMAYAISRTPEDTWVNRTLSGSWPGCSSNWATLLHQLPPREFCFDSHDHQRALPRSASSGTRAPWPGIHPQAPRADSPASGSPIDEGEATPATNLQLGPTHANAGCVLRARRKAAGCTDQPNNGHQSHPGRQAASRTPNGVRTGLEASI